MGNTDELRLDEEIGITDIVSRNTVRCCGCIGLIKHLFESGRYLYIVKRSSDTMVD